MKISRLFMALAAIALTSGCAAPRTSTVSDPLESFNRGMYQFNDVVDKAIAKPVAQGYDAVMPVPGKMMVSNFFSNLDDVIVTANDLLQLKFTQAASDGSRFLFNSTFGVFGLLDITSRLEKHDEDFGQTLGYWGVGSGPYIVLPILGPSTLRDSVGLYADSRPSKLRRVSHMRTRNQLYITKAISRRAELLEQEKVLDEAVIDRYAFIRDAYLLRRQSLVHDGNPPRQKYDEYDEEEDVEQKPVPIPTVPSSKLEQAPTVRPVSLDAKPALPALGPQTSADDLSSFGSPRRNILKVWVAQQDGIR
jgi:phospholipid-binding lipoprotein MlaA